MARLFVALAVLWGHDDFLTPDFVLDEQSSIHVSYSDNPTSRVFEAVTYSILVGQCVKTRQALLRM